MTAARLVVGVALLTLVIAFVVIVNHRDDGYTVYAQLENAGQLVPGNRVRIGAVDVGTVADVRLTPRGLAELKLSLDAIAAPLRRHSTLVVRATSLAGLASRYVVITPGAPSQPPIPDGGRITTVDTTAPVDFDALLNSLDRPTRAGLAQIFRGGAQQYGSRTAQARRSLRLLAPALGGTAANFRELARDRVALNRLLVRGAVAFRAIAAKRAHLSDLVDKAGVTTRAIAGRSEALKRSLTLLPGTLRRANSTFVDLRSALGDLEPLVVATAPAARRLPGFLRRLTGLLDTAAPTAQALSALTSSPGQDNDLVDFLTGLPRTAQVSAITTPRAIATLNRSQKFADTFLAYTPDLTAALSRLGEAASYYDANGHYLRAQPDVYALGYDAARNELVPREDRDRLGGLRLGAGARCPGGAVPPPPDRSAPLRVPGCSTATSLPSP